MKVIRNLFLLSCFVALYACEKDYHYVAPLPNPNVPVSFARDLQPILDQYCATSGCHSNGDNSPYLDAAEAYDQLWVNDGGNVLVDTLVTPISANNSIFYQRLIGVGAIMPKPPALPLSADKIALFKNWIEQGAHNN